MIKRQYYSIRTGKIQPDQQVNFDVLKRLFLVVYNKLDFEGYFQKYFGINCTDGYVEGMFGCDIDAYIFVNLKKENLFPIQGNLEHYDEDDLFDMIEFLYDHCSKGVDGHYHSWNNCGTHFTNFDDIEGRRNFRELINPILRDYKEGFEISVDGEILTLPEKNLSKLFEAELPTDDGENIRKRIENATVKFRRHKSSLEDRKEAIRELADVFEFLKTDVKQCLYKKDESDLFNIANNFGIRHHNPDQKTDYDKSIWFSWIFYFYLSTIHAVLRLIKKNKDNQLEVKSSINLSKNRN